MEPTVFNSISSLYNSFFDFIEHRSSKEIIALLARFIFASTMLLYFIHSSLLKYNGDLIHLSAEAYVQIVPKAFVAANFDPSKMGIIQIVIAHLGAWAEFLLPCLIVLGLFTRLASLMMIGFIAVMTYTDLFLHGTTGGLLFDRFSNGVIADVRLYWIFILAALACVGGGRLSLDRLLGIR